ncbi:MAG: hypothetical protein FJX35_22845 [Alphaproteobacteria bacterium]|nr:hypothetical protein [Alphaproteobacteria bacterium]
MFVVGRLVALCLALIVQPAVAGAADPRLLLSYEVTSAQLGFARLAEASYADRAAVTGSALADIVPAVVAALGIDPARIETQMTPGGYLGRTNASLQSKVALDRTRADRLAAGLGFVFRQSSVLVSDLRDRGGGTGFAIVRFAPGALDPGRAHHFFVHAGAVHKGLGGGYTAFGDDMILLNVRDEAGRPYSELTDAAFVRALRRAVAGFPHGRPRLAEAGMARAWFVGNSWRHKPDGADYVERLGGGAAPEMTALRALQARHSERMSAAADRFGWR